MPDKKKLGKEMLENMHLTKEQYQTMCGIVDDLELDDGPIPEEPKEEKPSDDKSFDLAMAVFDKKDFTESAIKFAANLKNFPEGKNFHKNLLYLGLSMTELENKNGACTAFAKIVNSKEDIEKNLVDRAVAEFDIMKCNPKVEEAKKENNANK